LIVAAKVIYEDSGQQMKYKRIQIGSESAVDFENMVEYQID